MQRGRSLLTCGILAVRVSCRHYWRCDSCSANLLPWMHTSASVIQAACKLCCFLKAPPTAARAAEAFCHIISGTLRNSRPSTPLHVKAIHGTDGPK